MSTARNARRESGRRPRSRPPADTPPVADEPKLANDDAPTAPTPPAARSAIVITTSRKRTKLERAEKRAAERDDDPEATARVRAFLDRMMRPR